MKIRNGFVSNSSSGSFIFPKKMTCDEVDEKLDMLIEFANKIEKTDKYTIDAIFNSGAFKLEECDIRYMSADLPDSEEIGKRGLVERYAGSCAVNTAYNSVPYWMHHLLCDAFGATYIHHG